MQTIGVPPSHALSVCLSLFSVLSGRGRLGVASHCPSQAWGHRLDRWQGQAPPHTNCLICELLSFREAWAGGATPAELGDKGFLPGRDWGDFYVMCVGDGD